MDNIFKDAKFGDVFFTKNKTRLIFVRITKIDNEERGLLVNESGALWAVPLDGLISQHDKEFKDYDILYSAVNEQKQSKIILLDGVEYSPEELGCSTPSTEIKVGLYDIDEGEINKIKVNKKGLVSEVWYHWDFWGGGWFKYDDLPIEAKPLARKLISDLKLNGVEI